MAERRVGVLAGIMTGMVSGMAAGGLSLLLGAAAAGVAVPGIEGPWLAPALATLFLVAGSLGPAGFFVETAGGSMGLGFELAPLPWAVIAVGPVILAASILGHRYRPSRSFPVMTGIAHGLTTGGLAGVGSIWATDLQPTLNLPVSPDLVAGRTAVITAALAWLVTIRPRQDAAARLYGAPRLGFLTMAVVLLAIWMGGLVAAVVAPPSDLRAPMLAMGMVFGGNVTTGAAFEALGAGATGRLESRFVGAGLDIGLADLGGRTPALSSLTLTVVMAVAFSLAAIRWGRGGGSDTRLIVGALGIALGAAFAAALFGVVSSGQVELFLVPTDPLPRSHTEVALLIDEWAAFREVGSRVLLVALPLTWLVGRRQEAAA